MTDFHDLQLKEQLLLQQKSEDDVDVDEGNVCDFFSFRLVSAWKKKGQL